VCVERRSAGAIIGIAWWADSTLPNSSTGVTVIGSSGKQIFVMTHQVGKIDDVWQITYDANQTVHMESETTATL